VKYGALFSQLSIFLFFCSFGLIQKNHPESFRDKIFQSSNRTKAPAPLAPVRRGGEKSSHRTLPNFICRKINDSSGCIYQF